MLELCAKAGVPSAKRTTTICDLWSIPSAQLAPPVPFQTNNVIFACHPAFSVFSRY